MAISKEKWRKAREYFEAGLSLSEIQARVGITKSQISKVSKKENWQKGNEKKHLIDLAVEVTAKKDTLKETALEVHNELVNEQLRKRRLIFSVSEKAVRKINEMLELIDNPKDLKDLVDAIDKSSITLNVNPRFSSSSIEVKNEVTTAPTEIRFVSKK